MKIIIIKQKILLFCGLLVLLLNACGESGNLAKDRTLKKAQNDIIFGARSNENIPQIAWEYLSATPKIQRRKWQQVTTARSSAALWNDDTKVWPGSAVAASAGQYMTAHHVVAAISKNGDLSLSDYNLTFPRGWRFNHNDPGEYTDQEGNHLPKNEHFHKDSWYLRYRLKSLGLDEDATRGFLHEDEAHFFVNYKSWNISDNYTHWAADNGNRDIAAIQIESRKIIHFQNLPSWNAIGPGVFFDYRKPLAYREAENEGDPALPEDPEKDDPLVGFFVHYPLRPASDPPTDYRESLVARDAIVRSGVKEKPCKDATSGAPRYCDELYGHYVRTNFDIKPGTSGGGVHWYPSDEKLGYFVGIIKGCYGSDCPDDDPEAEVAQEPADHATIFTPFDETISNYINKNRGFNGVPYRTSVSENPPAGSYEACMIDNPNLPSKCDGLLDEFLPSSDSHVIRGCAGKKCPSIGATDAYDGATDSSGSGISVGNSGGDHVDSIRDDLLWLRCWRRSDDYKMAIGIAGGRGEVNSEPHLGTVGVICQPYSFVEWSMNWDFLNAEFRPAPDNLEHDLRNNVGFMQFKWLHQILVEWYQKLDDQNYLTPLPMQLCAPGYIMRGLEATIGDKFIRGITAVYCVRPDVDPKDAECLADDSAYPCKIKTYVGDRFGDPKRDISQHIGAPKPGGDIKKLACKIGEYMSGVVVSRDSSIPTAELSISCAPY